MNENQKSAIEEAAENEFKHCHSAVDEVSYRHGFNHGAHSASEMDTWNEAYNNWNDIKSPEK